VRARKSRLWHKISLKMVVVTLRQSESNMATNRISSKQYQSVSLQSTVILSLARMIKDPPWKPSRKVAAVCILPEEQSCQISSRADLKRQSLRLSLNRIALTRRRPRTRRVAIQDQFLIDPKCNVTNSRCVNLISFLLVANFKPTYQIAAFNAKRQSTISS